MTLRDKISSQTRKNRKWRNADEKSDPNSDADYIALDRLFCYTGQSRNVSPSHGAGSHRHQDKETGYIILDVRTAEEYAAGHIPGAMLLPNETISSVPPTQLPDKDQLILVYCRSGNRSKQASQKLVDMGYTNIVEFGGIISRPGEIVTE